MNLIALKNELDTDPLVRGYSSMSDEEAAISLTTVLDRQADRETLDAGLVMASIVVTEWNGLTANQRQYMTAMMAVQTLPLTDNLKTQLQSVFGAGTVTRANLIALLKRDSATRADELKLGPVTPSDVADARRL